MEALPRSRAILSLPIRNIHRGLAVLLHPKVVTIRLPVLPALPALLREVGGITDLPRQCLRNLTATLQRQDRDIHHSLTEVVQVSPHRVQFQVQDIVPVPVPVPDMAMAHHLEQCRTDNHRSPCPRWDMRQAKQLRATIACKQMLSARP